MHQPAERRSAGADIDSFLQTWVPKITGSPAFKQGGLLEITFDEAADSDASSCCGEAPGPGASQPGGIGPGGGRIGTLLISPYIKPGSVSSKPYNHYSSLATWEQLFHLKRLADARTVKSTFGADVFTRYRGGSREDRTPGCVRALTRRRRSSQATAGGKKRGLSSAPRPSP